MRERAGSWWIVGRAAVLVLASLAAGVCSMDVSERPAAETAAASRPAAESDGPDGRPRLVMLGDSLTAGLGLDPDEAYPAVLQRRLDEAGYAYTVVNAGVSGDTTAGGLRRLDWSLEGDVHVLVVALGGNDGLRGLSVAEMKENLAEIIRRADARGARVILAGMEAPPNLGEAYTRQFRKAFAELARDHSVTFVPFLLDQVAGESDLNQRDGIHPNAAGARRLADNLWPALVSVLGPASTS